VGRVDVSAATRIRIDEPGLLADLERYLRAAECVAERVSSNELAVSVPGAPSAEQGCREIALYLSTWQALNPGVRPTTAA
jgi:hypothetical protein